MGKGKKRLKVMKEAPFYGSIGLIYYCSYVYNSV